MQELELAGELHDRRGIEARRQPDGPVVGELVCVRAHDQQVARGLHRREAGARHVHGGGALEDSDRGAHRRLELNDGRRGRVGRVHRLPVHDHRQPEHAVALLERGLERVQVHPDAVRVEERMPVRVLECLLVLLRHLRGLAQHEAGALAPPREVAALAVGLGAVDDLGDERQALAREPGEDARLEHRAEVVRVRQEQVLVAALQQGAEHPRRGERGEHVAVSRRRPLERRIGLPGDRLEGVREQLRHLALDEVEWQAVEPQVRVALERGQRVVARGEAVHQEQRDRRPVALAEMEHLAGDHVEEGVPVLHLEQGLRPRHPHAGAEPAVQLEHDHALERGRVPSGRSPALGTSVSGSSSASDSVP